MPNSLCRLKAVMGSSGKSVCRGCGWALLALRGFSCRRWEYLTVYHSSVGVQKVVIWADQRL